MKRTHILLATIFVILQSPAKSFQNIGGGQNLFFQSEHFRNADFKIAVETAKKQLSFAYTASRSDEARKTLQDLVDSAIQQLARNREDGSLKDDPDVHRNMTGLITSKGYPVEVYTVQTEDGFLLDLHRIPHGRYDTRPHNSSRPVVYLQHALLSSACDWVMNFPTQSLGFILADEGYDVWMGNSRGNTYSRRHVTLKPDQVAFWDWSFDEMAKYDMPAFIDFTLNATGHKTLYLIAHSQGTTMNFALLSQRPDIQEKIKLYIAFAPVAYVSHMVSPIAYMADLPDTILYDLLGEKEFLPSDEIIRFLVSLLCKDKATRWLCSNVLFLIVGYDTSNLNMSRIDVYFHHSPAGTSVKDLVHYAQLARDGTFRMYNYGSPEANEKHYHQPEPPAYDVTQIKIPIVAFTATHDWLADPTDATRLINSLPNLQKHYILQGWNHMDFIWGETTFRDCYTDVIVWLRKYP